MEGREDDGLGRTAAEGQPPDLFDGTPYRMVRTLGMGGSAVLYEVVHVRLGKHFIAKVLRNKLAADRQARERMEIEANASAQVQHPYLVDITDFVWTRDGRPAIIMERLRGADLRAELERLGYVPVRDAVRYVRQAALGLEAAHEKCIVHRDVKPENLFLSALPTGERVIKVLDLGLAKVPSRPRNCPTERDMFVGTPEYVAPEQLLGETVDGRADIYGLGVVLYELVAGRRPFAHSKNATYACLEESPSPPSRWQPVIPRRLDAIVLKAMHRDPAQRFQSARELAEALAHCDLTLSRDGSRSWVVTTSALITGLLTFGVLELIWGK